MRRQRHLIFVLVAIAVVSTIFGYFMPVLFMLPPLTAYLWLHKQGLYALFLSGLIGILPFAFGHDTIGSLVFVMVGLCGIVLGIFMSRGASLGVGIAFVSVSLFLLNAANVAIYWQDYETDWQEQVESFTASFDEGQSVEDSVALREGLAWLSEHWVYLSFGAVFGFILLVTTVLLSALYRRAGGEGLIAPANMYFSRMRVPEHLVWVAIALAGLWFWDSWRPNDALRLIAWNGAVALAVVYWLNGLSIVLFALYAFQPRMVFMVVFFTAFILLNLQNFLVFVGLFDTWWNFRLKIGHYIKARQQKI
ncbi:MAG: DUF2232 domain-containing protein [Candidatus Hydrogenedentes bacterium]|nr:DUF2232 domain-containing protein [Candidatus Hydrogenedentota bacterium]